MTQTQIKAAAQRMYTQVEKAIRVDFFDTWLTKLNLQPTVAKLEKARQALLK